MNRNQITMAAIGGVALVAVLAVGYLTYAARAEQGEKAEDLETALGNVRRINSAKIAPKSESVAAIDANAQKLDAWRTEVLALATAGDFAADGAATPESFKQKMVVEARELAKLPGGVNGNIVKEDFDFGFKDYIIGGSMPPRERLDALQRQWSEVSLLVKILARCGARELKAVTVGAAAEAPKEEEEQPKRRGPRKNAAKEIVAKDPATPQSYELKFTAKPAAFVRIIDACAIIERFIVVDGFSFAKEKDTLAEIFGGKEKTETSGGGRRGRGRRHQSAAEEQEVAAEEVNRKGLVTDPELDEPLTVTLKLTTYDFGTAAAAKEAGESEEAKEVAE